MAAKAIPLGVVSLGVSLHATYEVISTSEGAQDCMDQMRQAGSAVRSAAKAIAQEVKNIPWQETGEKVVAAGKDTLEKVHNMSFGRSGRTQSDSRTRSSTEERDSKKYAFGEAFPLSACIKGFLIPTPTVYQEARYVALALQNSVRTGKEVDEIVTRTAKMMDIPPSCYQNYQLAAKYCATKI